MKLLTIFLLVTVTGLTTSDKQEIKDCSTHKGMSCLTPKKAQASKCEGLPYYCPGKSICCKKLKTRKASNLKGRKKSCKNSRVCKERGGSCIKRRKTDCNGKLKKRLCDGNKCACCIEKSTCTKTSKKCERKDGFCFHQRKATCNGKVQARFCKGKHCACCMNGTATTECQCGIANTVRIIGDVVSPQNKYPWVVIIYIYLDDLQICGGSIINDRYVITSARCLEHLGTWISVDILAVGVADHNPKSSDDDINGVTRLHYVEKIIPHENYDSTSKDNDIILIKLKLPLDLTANKAIKPICLPTNDNKTYENEQGILAGWGRTDTEVLVEPSLEDLRVAKLSILGPDCPGNFSDGFVTNDNMLCAGLKDGGKSGCHGDGGGPLFVTEGSRHTLVGVLIYGSRFCETTQKPNVFTRVTRYLTWIEENTKDGVICED